MDRGARDGAKLYVAEKPMQLSENKGENPLLTARTTARRRGNPNTGKRILKAKSPGKKLRDQSRLNQFKAKRRRVAFGFAVTDNREPKEKGSGTEDSSSDLDFSECEKNDELDRPKQKLSPMILMPWTISKNFYKLLNVLDLLVAHLM